MSWRVPRPTEFVAEFADVTIDSREVIAIRKASNHVSAVVIEALTAGGWVALYTFPPSADIERIDRIWTMVEKTLGFRA